jgi:hypothetical protein
MNTARTRNFVGRCKVALEMKRDEDQRRNEHGERNRYQHQKEFSHCRETASCFFGFFMTKK